MTAGINGTVTLRIVGINREQDREGRHPFILTGVPIRLKPHDGGTEVPGAAQEPAVSDVDGNVTFTVSPGRYDVLAGPDGIIVETIDVTAGCELEHEIRLSTPVRMNISRTAQQDDWEPLGGDESITHTGHLRLRIEWLDSEQRFFPPDRGEKGASLRAHVLGFGVEVEGPVGRGRRSQASAAAAPAGRQMFEYRLLMPQSGPDSGVTVFFGTMNGRLTGDLPLTLEIEPYRVPTPIEGSISVGLRRTASRLTEDVPLWIGIRKSTDALSFDRYYEFMNWVFCDEPWDHAPRHTGQINEQMAVLNQRRRLPFTDTDAYRNIKVATEAFVMANCGIFSHIDRFDAEYVVDQVVVPASPRRLRVEAKRYLEPVEGISHPGIIPYLAIIRRKLADQRIESIDIGDVVLGLNREHVDACYGLIRRKLTCPCFFELIWSYWQEEGMLVQTMNALARRFQNVRSPHSTDPLANLEIDALRSLNSIIWGYIQDEQHRLSVVRRNYEYDHQYGLRLAGRAVQDPRTADSRSKFLEAFHTLLSITANFYKRDDDTTIVADGFPVLNGLKEAHLILSQSAQNQYGEMPSTARIEMLMQQWILSRPEFREFLPTRIMVAYPEPWMDRVDAMKKLQGWTDTSVLHFRNLAVFGEQILLSMRYGAWAAVNDPVQATNWARYWRPEVQGYLHAYRSVTGIDLSVDVTNARIDATLPSVHLVHRLEEQLRRA
jgi:hypothetical protein